MSIKGYKAFNKGLICNNKQYEENTVFEETGTEICKPGVMHFCENPFNVLNYYPLVNNKGEICEFSEVEALGDVYKLKDKSATSKLKIGLKLNLKGFIKACIDFTFEKAIFKSDTNTGYSAQLASSGNYAQLASSGDYAQLASSGNGAQLASSGDSAKLASSGNYAQLVSKGKHSVVAAIGINSVAKAKIGNWITLVEWTMVNGENGEIIWTPKCVKTEFVDGERIKEDTFYKLVDGKFKTIESEE